MQNTNKLTSNLCVQLLGIFIAILFASTLSFAQPHSLPSQDSSQRESIKKQNHSHWDYLGIEGPKHWGLLSKEYVTCETGNKQSPVNIHMQGRSHHQEGLKFNYRVSELHEMNNGHTIQVSHNSGCNIDLNKKTYNLRQFHFHDPSEHHINGKTFPIGRAHV